MALSRFDHIIVGAGSAGCLLAKVVYGCHTKHLI
jgi:hypothetical protein